MRQLFLVTLLAAGAWGQRKVVVFGVNAAQLEELRKAAPSLQIVGATSETAAREIAEAEGVI